MKCIACGREMLDMGTHYECSNVLCDYEEEIEFFELLLRGELPSIDPEAALSIRSISADPV